MSVEHVSPFHAHQLARCLGALKTLQPDLHGSEYRIVGSARKVLTEHAERIDYEVHPAEFAEVNEPELRSISTFCDSTAERFDGDDAQRLVAAADIARERLQEVRDE